MRKGCREQLAAAFFICKDTQYAAGKACSRRARRTLSGARILRTQILGRRRRKYPSGLSDL
jgi:hypothetical protein